MPAPQEIDFKVSQAEVPILGFSSGKVGLFVTGAPTVSEYQLKKPLKCIFTQQLDFHAFCHKLVIFWSFQTNYYRIFSTKSTRLF